MVGRGMASWRPQQAGPLGVHSVCWFPHAAAESPDVVANESNWLGDQTCVVPPIPLGVLSPDPLGLHVLPLLSVLHGEGVGAGTRRECRHGNEEVEFG